MSSSPIKPLVSIIVPCYNYARYLPECLSSIFRQRSTVPLELIAIDDASTDGTREVLEGISDPRLTVVLHPENRGHAVTINEGLRLAQGSYIARIDPDDRYRENFLSEALEKFERFPDVGLVYGDAAMIDADGKTTLASCDRAHGGADFHGSEFIRLLEWNYICAPTVLARREAWLQVPPVPVDLAFNDWYFNLQMARRWPFYYVNKVVADYRVHPMNHHSQIIRNRKDEPSVFRLLDGIYAEPESSPELETAKHKRKNRIYGAQYLTLAEKYFHFGMNEDAARCYRRAASYDPLLLLKPGPARRFAATIVGRGLYEKVKGLLR